MKSSLLVICALFASVSAIRAEPEESVDLQLGVEATARSNVREMLKTNLRAALERPSGISRHDIDAYILPGSVPVMPIPSDSTEVQLIQLRDDDLPTVADAKAQAAQMQAQMDQAIAEADAKRA